LNVSNEILLGLLISFTVPVVIVGTVMKLVGNSAKNEHIKAENTDLRACLDIYVDYHEQHNLTKKHAGNFKKSSYWQQENDAEALNAVVHIMDNKKDQREEEEVKDTKGLLYLVPNQGFNTNEMGPVEEPIKHNGFLPPKITTFQRADMPDIEFLNKVYASLGGHPKVVEVHGNMNNSDETTMDMDSSMIVTSFEELDWNHSSVNEMSNIQPLKFQWRLGRNLLHFKIIEQLSENLMSCEILGCEEKITLSHTSFSNFSKKDTFAAMIVYQDDDNKEVLRLWKVTDEAEFKLINIDKEKEKIEFSWEVGQHFLHFHVLESFNDDMLQCEIVGTLQTVMLKSDKLRDFKVSMGFAARINVDAQGNKEIIKIWGNEEKAKNEEYNWNFVELNGHVSEG
jgi:hypothetical protein